jgi:fatty acid desaturase
MESHPEVVADLAELRSQLRSRGGAHAALLRLNPIRPLIDVAFDYVVVLCCVWAVVELSLWLAPLAVIVIANRQRALGNILHDAGHRNLCRDERWNDLMAHTLIAPVLFANLSSYRETHYRHHLALGDVRGDPDFLPIPDTPPHHWLRSYARHLQSWPAWLGSFAGHLANDGLRWSSKLLIVGWWSAALVVLLALTGVRFTAVFAILWLLARATVFHLITTFREMCDHFGLRPGGVFSFTRDITCHGFWRQFIHPRNNGYHLTHHLLPAVPYYRLPEAQRLFRETPAYRMKATVCQTYFAGDDAVTRAWQAEATR